MMAKSRKRMRAPSPSLCVVDGKTYDVLKNRSWVVPTLSTGFDFKRWIRWLAPNASQLVSGMDWMRISGSKISQVVTELKGHAESIMLLSPRAALLFVDQKRPETVCV
jgi:hypothetical protein